jgi:bacterioferritin (cytochrome b1)
MIYDYCNDKNTEDKTGEAWGKMRKVHKILIQKLKVRATYQTLRNQPSQRHKHAHKIMDRNMYTGGIPLVPLIQDREKRNKMKGNNTFKTFQQSV